MTEKPKEEGVPAAAGAPAKADGQAAAGASDEGVNLEAEAGKHAKKRERERASLDSFTNPQDRELAQRIADQAVTDYRKSLEAGKSEDFFTRSQAEKWMRDKQREMEAVSDAKARYAEAVAEMGLKRDTEDYKAFDAEAKSGIYDLKGLGDPDKVRLLVERIASNARVGKFKPKQELPAGGLPYIPTAGVALKQGQTLAAAVKNEEMDATRAEYERLMKGGQ